MQIQENYSFSGKVVKWLLMLSILLNFAFGIHFWYRKTFEYQANQTILKTNQRFEQSMIEMFENCNKKRQAFEVQFDQTLAVFEKKLEALVPSGHQTQTNVQVEPQVTPVTTPENEAIQTKTPQAKTQKGWGLFVNSKTGSKTNAASKSHTG